MRMWMIEPETMCRKHLLGEHVELHMLCGCIIKGKLLSGYKKLIETHNIKTRHQKLITEMKRRGYNHKSPLPYFDLFIFGRVNPFISIIDLHKRCTDCKNRWWKWFGNLDYSILKEKL